MRSLFFFFVWVFSVHFCLDPFSGVLEATLWRPPACSVILSQAVVGESACSCKVAYVSLRLFEALELDLAGRRISMPNTSRRDKRRRGMTHKIRSALGGMAPGKPL